MSLDNLLTICTVWLAVDAFADVLCIALCLACVAIVKNAIKRVYSVQGIAYALRRGRSLHGCTERIKS